MKIRPEDYKRLETLVNATLEKFPLEKTQADYQARGLSQTRLVWDYFHATVQRLQITDGESYVWMRGIYDYLNDNHIETALKRIILGESK